jgi:phosphatidylinositol-3,4,5-trisphosphate 3-phosphatase/dual-specificity protein phosphatase PTEN
METLEAKLNAEQIPVENSYSTQAYNIEQEGQVYPTEQRDNPTGQQVNPTQEVNYPTEQRDYPTEQQGNPTEEVNNPNIQQVNPTEEVNNAVQLQDNQNIPIEIKNQITEIRQENPIEHQKTQIEPEYPIHKEEGVKRNAKSVYRTNALIVRNQDDDPEELKAFTEPQSFIQSEIGEDSDEGPSKEVLGKDNSYCIKNQLVPRFSCNELTQAQLSKIFELKVLTEETISKTVKTKKSSNKIKSLVSKNKNRFCYDGYDLDLTYITTRIIAMGIPSTSIKGIYRNSMDKVQSFLNTRHPSQYKVFNLCKEKEYSDDLFFKQGYYPIEDHEAPPINSIIPFCLDAKSFLNEDPNNIIAVHSKAGKGRAGTFICCLLMFMRIFDTADECLQYYGMMRMESGKGLTVPSQIRYVEYFEKILKNNMGYPLRFIRKCFVKIRMFTIPMFQKKYMTSFSIDNSGFTYNSGKQKHLVHEQNNAVLDFIIDNLLIVEGDVQVVFYRNHMLGKKEKIFKFWFNTNFIPNNGNIIELNKKSIDIACKDKDCKYFKSEFKIEVHLANVK